MIKYEKGTEPICYLDCDGVIYYYPIEGTPYFRGSHVEVRPYLFALLQNIHDWGFELRLLTCNRAGGEAMLNFVEESGCGQFTKWWPLTNIPSCYHAKQYHNGLTTKLEKAAYIDLTRPFIWLEDGIVSEECEMLQERGWCDRYFEIDAHEPDEFLRALPWINQQAIKFGLIEG